MSPHSANFMTFEFLVTVSDEVMPCGVVHVSRCFGTTGLDSAAKGSTLLRKLSTSLSKYTLSHTKSL